MSLGRIPYFITIAETGNITKAAQILRVSQPSLSQYLTRLEAEVGMPLLEQMLFFRPSSEYYLHHVFTKYLNELNVTPCNIREVSNLSAILAYINDVGNDALTLSSEFALQDPAVRHGNLAFFHVKEHPAYWYFTLNAPAEGELSYAGKLFWSFVSQVLNAKPEPNSF